MKRRAIKKFKRGDAVEFQRCVGSAWETGTYDERFPSSEWRGWHSVRLNDDADPKDINAMSGETCERDHPQAVLSHHCSVPTQRLRARSSS